MQIGCEGGESVVVGTASVAVSPPGGSSGTSKEVNKLTAVTHEAIPPVLKGGLTPAVLPSYRREQLEKVLCDDPVLGTVCREGVSYENSHSPVGLDILPVVGPSLCGRSQSLW